MILPKRNKKDLDDPKTHFKGIQLVADTMDDVMKVALRRRQPAKRPASLKRPRNPRYRPHELTNRGGPSGQPTHDQLASIPLLFSGSMASRPRRKAISTINEFDLIRALQRRYRSNGPGVLRGIGDDAAVIASEPRRSHLFTTDLLAEGIPSTLRPPALSI